MRIGIIGDFNPESRYHHATNESIRHAALALAFPFETNHRRFGYIAVARQGGNPFIQT